MRNMLMRWKSKDKSSGKSSSAGPSLGKKKRKFGREGKLSSILLLLLLLSVSFPFPRFPPLAISRHFDLFVRPPFLFCDSMCFVSRLLFRYLSLVGIWNVEIGGDKAFPPIGNAIDFR